MKATWIALSVTLIAPLVGSGVALAQSMPPCPPTTATTSAPAPNMPPDVRSGPCVPAPPLVCRAAPTVSATTTGPGSILVRDGSMIDVVVSGTVTLPVGCTLQSASYTLDDEYGLISGSGTVSVATDGTFSLGVPVQGSRRGTDRDGRTYTIVVSAKDEAGTASSAPIISTVAHDSNR